MNDGLRGYDAWKETAPDLPSVSDARGGHGPFSCLDCAWQGSIVHATAHHRETRHHRIVNRHGLIQIFGCCSDLTLDASLLIERTTCDA